MNSPTPEKILAAINQMQWVDRNRAANRSRINSLFNGNPPYSSKEAEENNIQTNVNFLEASRIAGDARQTFSNALMKPGNYFSVQCDYGPPHLRMSYSKIVEKEINRVLKRSLPYAELLRSTIAQVVLHGVGPVYWQSRSKWMPTFLGVEDLLLPSRSLVSLENVTHFAIYREFTPQQLKEHSENAPKDSGWNKKLVNSLVSAALKNPTGGQSIDYYMFPEKLEEDWKSQSWYWGCDAVTTVKLWDFYYQDDEGGAWRRRLINEPGQNQNGADSTEGGPQFVFNPGEREYAENISQLLHIQFADGANVAPFRYHSVRSLGYLLYAVCNLANRFRCQFMDRAFESMMIWFRNALTPAGEKPEVVNLHNYAVLPDGVGVVPAAERHGIDENMVAFAQNQLRQLMSESSASYTQDLERTSHPQETATKTMARVNNASALIGAMLNMAYLYEKHKYIEICRRFCQPNSGDPDIEKFQENVMRQGVPKEAIDSERWDIEPERVVGNGVKSVELAQADRLMSVYPLLNPQSQQEALHIYVEANTDDPQLAARLVPPSKPLVNDATQEATFAAAALMHGLPVGIRAGINQIDYIETLLKDLAILVQRTNQSGGVPSKDELIGMDAIAGHIEQHLQLLSQQKSEKERVKKYADILSKLNNEIRAFAQRLAEQEQAQNQQNGGVDPETAGKVQQGVILAQSKAQTQEALARQKMQLKDIAFQSDQRRRDAKLSSDIRRDFQTTQADVVKKAVNTRADIAAKDITTQADILRENSFAEQTEE